MTIDIESGVRSALFALNLSIDKATPTIEVLDLISKLRPKDCGIDLIRVGGDADGGYLIPDDLEGIEYCFSPGVSTLSEFENQLADLHIRSFLADYSVDFPTIMRPEFTFDKKYLGSYDRDPFVTLAIWKDKYLKDYSGDLLLQMDIEGFEYEVILSTPDSLLDQFRIMVIEFHNLDRLFNSIVFRLFSSVFEKILKSFHVVHIHPNNCYGGEIVKRGNVEIPKVMEFTFLNKKRAKGIKDATILPHPLDSDNAQRKPLPLPRCWYRHA